MMPYIPPRIVSSSFFKCPGCRKSFEEVLACQYHDLLSKRSKRLRCDSCKLLLFPSVLDLKPAREKGSKHKVLLRKGFASEVAKQNKDFADREYAQNRQKDGKEEVLALPAPTAKKKEESAPKKKAKSAGSTSQKKKTSSRGAYQEEEWSCEEGGEGS